MDETIIAYRVHAVFSDDNANEQQYAAECSDPHRILTSDSCEGLAGEIVRHFRATQDELVLEENVLRSSIGIDIENGRTRTRMLHGKKIGYYSMLRGNYSALCEFVQDMLMNGTHVSLEAR